MKIKSKKHRRKLTDILNAISTESHYLAYQINGYDDISTISHDSVDNRVEDLDQMISRYMQLRGVSNA